MGHILHTGPPWAPGLPSNSKKRKVKRRPNANLLLAFKELTKTDESNIQAYEESKAEKIRNQDELLAGQQDERQVIIEGNKRPRDTHYEELWASKDPGTKMPKEGRGKYSWDKHIGKTGNLYESRHMDTEAKRLRYRGKQYMSLSNYKIMPAKKVIMFRNCNVILLYLKFFLQLILIIMVIYSV